jgi:hypothetical protein
MRKLGLLVVLVGALAVPSAASAARDGASCSYTSSQSVLVNQAGVVVYTGSGTTGTASTAAGVCVDEPAAAGVGGTLEAGTGAPGTYAILDGDNNNPDPADGYVGLSNYETGTHDSTCDETNGGTGSNSGGCFGVKGVAEADLSALSAVPTPICGNTSDPNWDATIRDGCQIP